MVKAALPAREIFIANFESPPPRSIKDFAESEVVLSRGKFRGHPFRCSRFPASGIWFDLIDAHDWLYYVATGPTQSGKSLCCFIIPIMWCLFEKREDVIVGIPHLDMANDKWRKDIKPAIERSRYAEMLPRSGEGSKGGKVRVISFRNGCHLTFMSFGGDDKSKAGETAPNLIITETDGANESQTTSEEADPIEQLCARTGSYDKDALIVMECTVSTIHGQTWTRYEAGTGARLVRPCPHCNMWVSPERRHFKGWRGAENEIEAGVNAAFHCPECDRAWTDRQRFRANEATRIVHRGQEVTPEGEIVGTPVPTRTCGFRWSAVDNMFRSSDLLGSMEWQAARARKQDNAQKSMDQFQYATPWVPEDEDDDDGLDPYSVETRVGDTQRRRIPAGQDLLTVGVDLRKRQLHYAVTAWNEGGTGTVVDYGTLKVHSDRLGLQKGWNVALTWLRDSVLSYKTTTASGEELRLSSYADEDGEPVDVQQVWIDTGYRPELVHPFVDECNDNEYWKGYFRACVGRGHSVRNGGYQHKDKVTKKITFIGDQYYFSLLEGRHPVTHLTIINADHWKSFLHERLSTELGERGSMRLFIPDTPEGHQEYCRHLASEKGTRQFIPEKGEVVKWVTESRANHYLDATYMACAAGHFVGVEIAPAELSTDLPAVEEDEEDEGGDDNLTMPDGREFYL